MVSEKKAFFITGTDTDCGKTRVSASLIKHLQLKHRRVAGMKPIASGFERLDGEWRNDDIEALKQASNVDLAPKHMNRYAYQPAIAPHIAAERVNEVIDLNLLAVDVKQALEDVDALVVEAVGGWLVPLSSDTSDNIQTLARKLKLPIVLVVGLKLGCLNHALLTAQAILHSGLPFAGWVANHIDPNFECAAENIATLCRQMPVPKLFELPYIHVSDDAGEIGAFSDHWLSLSE